MLRIISASGAWRSWPSKTSKLGFQNPAVRKSGAPLFDERLNPALPAHNPFALLQAIISFKSRVPSPQPQCFPSTISSSMCPRFAACDSNDHAKLQREIHSATSLHIRCITIAFGGGDRQSRVPSSMIFECSRERPTGRLAACALPYSRIDDPMRSFNAVACCIHGFGVA